MAAIEESVEFSHYSVIALKKWMADQGGASLLLCLHGWLDNAASFDRLAPRLLETRPNTQLNKYRDVWAVDFPGHGYSCPVPGTGPIQFCEWIRFLDQFLNFSKLSTNPSEKVTLVGHSMGAAVAWYYAATFPERVEKLVLIDGGPIYSEAALAPAALRKALEHERAYEQSKKERRSFASLDEAVERRLKHGSISADAARAIMQRNTELVNAKLVFRADPRLELPSAMKWSLEETKAFVSNLTMPILMIESKADTFSQFRKRVTEVLSTVPQLELFSCGDDHYPHWQYDELLAERINTFLKE